MLDTHSTMYANPRILIRVSKCQFSIYFRQIQPLEPTPNRANRAAEWMVTDLSVIPRFSLYSFRRINRVPYREHSPMAVQPFVALFSFLVLTISLLFPLTGYAQQPQPLNVAPTQNKPTLKKKTESPQAGTLPPIENLKQENELIDEIASLRQQLGGGVAAELSGLSIDEQELENEFRNQLSDLVEGGESNQQNRLQSPSKPNQANQLKPLLKTPELGTIQLNLPLPSIQNPNLMPLRQTPKPNSTPQPSSFSNPLVQRHVGRKPDPAGQTKDLRFQNRSAAQNQGQVWRPNPTNHTVSQRAQISNIERIRSSAKQLEEMAAELEGQGLYREADRLRETAIEFWHRARELGSSAKTNLKTLKPPVFRPN